MTRWVVPGAESLSEFVGLPNHQYGDCGPDAVFMGLHAIFPSKYPLTAAGLGSITNAEEAGGYADAGGAQDIVHMHEYLSHLGISHHTYGYTDFDINLLHTQLKQYLGQHWLDILVVEYSQAGAGFPDDELNVHYHFNMFAGEDDSTPAGGYIGGYLRGDGDSHTDSQTGAATPLILTPWEQIQAAVPIAYIIIHNPATVNPPAVPAATGTAAAPTVASSQPATITQADGVEGEYVVQSADLAGGLAGIAAQFGVTLAALIAANQHRFITPDQIHSGMILVIPAV